MVTSILIFYKQATNNLKRKKMDAHNNICLPGGNQLEISFRMEDSKSHQGMNFNFKHTRHSFLRASQRGINSNKIAIALQFGDNIYKQGLIYFILGENNIPASLSKDKDKLINTVVVVSGNSNEVITCYRSSNPFRNIRVKSKKLCRKFENAA